MPGENDGGAGGTQNGQGAKTYTQEQLDAEVGGLKAKNTELLGEVRTLKDRFKAFDGLDPEKVKAAIAAQTQAEADKQRAAGDWEAREKTLREAFKADHEKVVTPLQEQNARLAADLFEAVAVRDAMEAMGLPSVKGNPKLLLPVIKAELGIVELDGRRITVIKGPDGKPRYHPTTGNLVTVEDRLKELRAVPDYAGAFEGTGGSGSGSRGGGGGGDAGGVITLTPEQAADANQYQAALKKVGGDYSKVKIASAA